MCDDYRTKYGDSPRSLSKFIFGIGDTLLDALFNSSITDIEPKRGDSETLDEFFSDIFADLVDRDYVDKLPYDRQQGQRYSLTPLGFQRGTEGSIGRIFCVLLEYKWWAAWAMALSLALSAAALFKQDLGSANSAADRKSKGQMLPFRCQMWPFRAKKKVN